MDLTARVARLEARLDGAREPIPWAVIALRCMLHDWNGVGRGSSIVFPDEGIRDEAMADLRARLEPLEGFSGEMLDCLKEWATQYRAAWTTGSVGVEEQWGLADCGSTD
jgi:hypothetical protein